MSRATGRLAAVREVLRHLDHPERLRQSPLVGWQFAADSEAIAAQRVKEALEVATEALPSRRREIIRRCDLRGQSHAKVINDLGLSERHFYRERRFALESIGLQLAAPSQTVVAVRRADVADERLTLLMSFVEAARQVGDAARAITLLKEASTKADVSGRVQIECRLGELYCELGSIDRAVSHLNRAGEVIRDSGAPGVLRLLSDSTQAAVSWRLGHVESATTCADRVIYHIGKTAPRPGTPAETRALALSLLVLSEIEVAQGRWRTGRRHALQARDAISAAGLGALKSRAALAASFAYMFEPAHLNDAAYELETQYRSAIAAGLTLEAVLIRIHSSLTYRFANAPHKSAVALEEILLIAKQVLPPEQYAIVCLELAKSYVLCGEPQKAHQAIDEGRTRVLPTGNTSAFVALLSAAAFLLEGEYQRALDLSVSAWKALTSLGIVTSVGESLRIQAEAKYALGEPRSAKELIGAALKSLEAGGHPFTIAQAHASAGRITGDRKHVRLARDIFRNLRVSP